MNVKYLFIIFVCLSIFASCKSYTPFYIDVLKPAPTILPPGKQKILLINRSMNDHFSNLNSDTLNKSISFAKKKARYAVLDSIASDSILKTLSAFFNENGLLNIVIPKNPNLYKGVNAKYILTKLDWSYVNKMCNLYHTDMLAALEVYYTDITTLYSKLKTGDTALLHHAEFDIAYQTHWRIYDPEHKKVVTQHMIKDTISWGYTTSSQLDLIKNIPDIRDALCHASYEAAIEYANQISPKWLTQKRIIFNKGDKILSESAKLIQLNQFTEARDLLTNKLPQLSANNKSKASYNIALSFELEGNIDKAIYWANRSNKIQFRNQVVEYLKILNIRKTTIQKIEESLSNK